MTANRLMNRKRLTHEERRLQTRERLLEAAQALFIKRGFGATSLEQIADAAGYTRGAFYSNFKDKADLLIESLRLRGPNLSCNLRAVISVLNHYLQSEESFRLWVEASLVATQDPAFRARFDSILGDERVPEGASDPSGER